MHHWSREDLRGLGAFFIVGAPRCGTTTLASMLKGHPAVCFAVPKEPHYFSRLPTTWSSERVLADYLPAYFRHWDGAAPVLGEGSPSYLYSDRAVGAIDACFPGARYIVMVRDPLELVASHHKRMLYTLDEDEPDLAKAWALQEQRRRGERVPRRCRDPRLLDYEGVGRVGARCEALLRRAGRERVRFVLLEDLRADPLGTYRGTLAFLSLEDDGRTALPRRNESRAVRSVPLHLLLSQPRSEAVRVALARLRRSRRFRPAAKLLKRLRRANREASAPAPLTPEMREMLSRAFAEDVRVLSRVVGRDLGHWLDLEKVSHPRLP
jgi:Sulfotransferase family